VLQKVEETSRDQGIEICNLKQKMEHKKRVTESGENTRTITDQVESFCDKLRSMMISDQQQMKLAFEDTLRAGKKLDRIAERMRSTLKLTFRADRQG
jgi:hypothetical protein